MHAFYSSHIDINTLRTHPWTSMKNNINNIYIDFKEHPELIRSQLEDFQDFKQEAFTETFYQLLEWINDPLSSLESNDCTLNIAEKNTDKEYAYQIRCGARLMILFRDIAENCQQKSSDWLMQSLLQQIASTELNFHAGAIGVSPSETCYLALGNGIDSGGMGQQIQLTFFAYGNNEQHCYANLNKVFKHIQFCLKEIDKQIKQGAIDALYV